MNKIEELIAELCPNGVEWKEVWEITTWDKKFNAVDNYKQPKIIKYHYLLANDLKSLVVKEGSVKILTTNSSNIYTTEKLAGNRISNGEVVAIPWGGNPNVQYYKGKFITADNRIATSNDTSILSNKFLYYYLLNNLGLISSFYRGSGIKHPSMSAILDMSIPIPPLAIQKEIVQILDKFSTLTAELQAELQARKSQYEYYRNQLLAYPKEESDQLSLRSSRSDSSFKENDNSSQPQSAPNPHADNSVLQPHDEVQWKTLGEVTLRTENIKWKETNEIYQYIDLTSVSRDNNAISETIKICNKTAPSRAQKIVETDDVIFATTRPTQMRIALICDDYHGQIASTGYCILRANKKYVLPKWIFFYLTTTLFKNYLEENQSGSAYPAISDGKLKEYKIPVPPLSEQERIVAILDKFDSLVNDISSGLPAEIAARRKQYEYYREKLLNFEVKGKK